MRVAFILLSAATAAAAPVDRPDLVRIWECRFDNEETSATAWDVNYDLWPDRWDRVYDEDHPRYSRIEIREVADPGVYGRRLSIDPDGASATAVSPPISVRPKFSYRLRLNGRLTGAEHGKACVHLAFYAGDELRQVESTAPFQADGRWRLYELGDFQPSDPDVDRVYVQVDFERGRLGDLNAEMSVADLRLYRLPSIRIHTDSEYNVYTDPRDVLVRCSLSGIIKQNPEVRFQLFDATDQSIGEGGVLELNGKKISESRTLASEIVDGFHTDKPSYEGSIDWRPSIQGYGFYRVRVGMYNPETDEPIGDARSITVAVVRKGLENSDQGEFGWSLPNADRPLSFPVLQELLPRAGVRLVKVPVWFTPGDEERGDQILGFAEQLAARDVEMIGVIEDPTPRIADPLSEAPAPDIENLLTTDASYWTPLIDHVITRLSLRIRWWQLGNDDDTSFVGYDHVIDRIRAIRNQMFRFGQDIRLGLGWRWDHAMTPEEKPSWDFLQMTGRSRLDAEGLEQALKSAPPSAEQRWVIVEPPDVPLEIPEGADVENPDDPLMRRALVRRHQKRVRDFVEQILVAKVYGAEGVFVADPFSGEADTAASKTGVMNRDGSPGELLLPWRTCARLLGGARYIGSIRLPYGSSNWLFIRPDGRVVMVLWNLSVDSAEANATPVEEVLYLGENLQVVDVWGDTQRPEMRDGRHVIPVGRMPRFVLGLNEAIARWRIAVQFESSVIPSIFGVKHPNNLMLSNTFGQGIGVRLRVLVPTREAVDPPLSTNQSKEWEVLFADDRFSAQQGQDIQLPFEVSLRDAGYGDQLVRIDFEVVADSERKFSAWRDLRVGLDGLSLSVRQMIHPSGKLVIEQTMQNTTGQPGDFQCQLHVPGRRRKRTQVYQLGADEDTKTYTYRASEGLIGQEMRLRIEESYGRRVLIYRFKVDPEPYDPNEEQAADAEGDELAFRDG